MKKYSWVSVLIFAIAFAVFAFIISKNGAVRDTFVKVEADLGRLPERIAADIGSSLYINI